MPSTRWATSCARGPRCRKRTCRSFRAAPRRSRTSKARAARQKAYGYPLALKASGGGGGKGLKIAHDDGELESAFETARREAEAYFKNPTIYAERYLDNPKHIELQILADKHGTVLHVGERDCSLQRRHQKLWEEAPARLPADLRREMRAAAVRAAKAIGYDSVGTIECLVAGSHFFFLEMNTRIQVEHTVTEMVTGMDIDPRADSRRRRRTARFPSRRDPVSTDSPSKDASTPRIRRKISGPRPGRSARIASPAARACASIRPRIPE